MVSSAAVTTRNCVPSLSFNHIVAAAAEKDLPRHRGRHGVFRLRRLRSGKLDVVRADRHRGCGARRAVSRRRSAAMAPAKSTCAVVARVALEHVARADEAGDELRARPVVDIFRRSGLLDLAAIHHRDEVRRGHRLGLVVGDVDRGVAVMRRAGGAPRSASPRANWRRDWTAARRAAASRARRPARGRAPRAAAGRRTVRPDSARASGASLVVARMASSFLAIVPRSILRSLRP